VEGGKGRGESWLFGRKEGGKGGGGSEKVNVAVTGVIP